MPDDVLGQLAGKRVTDEFLFNASFRQRSCLDLPLDSHACRRAGLANDHQCSVPAQLRGLLIAPAASPDPSPFMPGRVRNWSSSMSRLRRSSFCDRRKQH